MILQKCVWASIVVAAAAAVSGARSIQPPSAQPSGDQVDRGRKTFVRVGCYECHGREGQGASTGPRLGPNSIAFEAFTRAVRTPRNEMPPYGPRILSNDELADIYAFVESRPAAHAPGSAELPSSLSPIVGRAGHGPPPPRLRWSAEAFREGGRAGATTGRAALDMVSRRSDTPVSAWPMV